MTADMLHVVDRFVAYTPAETSRMTILSESDDRSVYVGHSFPAVKKQMLEI